MAHADRGRRGLAASGAERPKPARSRPEVSEESASMPAVPPAAAKRRSVSIRLAVVLGIVALAFYLGMFLLGGR